jgi:hypothetical protein
MKLLRTEKIGFLSYLTLVRAERPGFNNAVAVHGSQFPAAR